MAVFALIVFIWFIVFVDDLYRYDSKINFTIKNQTTAYLLFVFIKLYREE